MERTRFRNYSSLMNGNKYERAFWIAANTLLLAYAAYSMISSSLPGRKNERKEQTHQTSLESKINL